MRKLNVFLVSSLLIGGCSYEYFENNLVPDSESNFAKDFLQKIQYKEFEYVKSQIDAELVGEVTDEKLNAIADYFPKRELISVELIGSQTYTFNSLWQGNFSFEYQFTDGWALANAVLKREGDKLSVIGFNVYRTTASQRDLTAFSAADLTPTRVIALLLTVFVPVFMFVTCYVVYKTPIPEKKKRWYFFSFLGLFEFSFNWTTGVLNFQLLTVKILGTGMVAAGPFAPWILSFTFPIGAIMFWAKRRQLMSTGPSELPIDAKTDQLPEK